ncbi:DEAD-box ATP-dependent RNA helicase CshA [hydrothermal vent metagenome]|uniref:DEAD-box ATP-dependent RNA helicase CshA n=1 Tax=hydrothermal vent metagenome TaxID=652676 RepID=A0A3B1EA85_9ZZZZ
MKFINFNLKKDLERAVDAAGFVEASPIQQQAIPVVMSGKDIVAQAQTGTGKTAAFGLPVLNNMKCDGTVETVVIVPTRELAMQVSDELFRFGKFLNIKTATVYGGSSYSRQIKHVEAASIIVTTPGRFLDLLKNKQIKINPSFVVLDEADEMMDMGFLEDIRNIFKFMPDERQTLMFSATMPEPIKKLAKTVLSNPEFITITKSEVTNTNITQSFYVVEEYERDDALMRLFDYKNPYKSIVFCRMKRDVDRLATYLVSQGYSAKGLHGDMEQRQREEVIKAFKGNRLEVLVATDVAARGLDIKDVSHVFNYQLPFDSEPYVHRIGRTGRAGKDGIAVSIVTPAEFRSLKKIQKDVGTKIESKVIPTIGDVKNKQKLSLVNVLKAQDIDEKVCDFIDDLKEDFDLSTIVYKLASYIRGKEKVNGRDRIGKSLKDIELMLSRVREGGGGNRNRSQRRRNTTFNRSRNGNARGRSKNYRS